LANPEHLAKLQEGVEAWNQWEKEHPELLPLGRRLAQLRKGVDEWNQWKKEHSAITLDFSGADLSGAYLCEANFEGADFTGARLRKTHLGKAQLRGANLKGADLSGAFLSSAMLYDANLSSANLSDAQLDGADLREVLLVEANLSNAFLAQADLQRSILRQANLCSANLCGANLMETDLNRADLSGANLERALLINTNMEASILTGCYVHGISAWDIKLENAVQSNLVITPRDQPIIQVDNLEVAQFIYLLLNNQKIRSVIDTITSKVVLILGRFTPERKVVLDAIRDELRKRDYLPVLFDFEKPASRDLTETVSTLAHMARFVIADITDAKSISQELMAIVPNMPSVPVQPLLLASQQEYGMFEHFRNFPWVLQEVLYDDQQTLLAELSEKVIAPAEAKAKELARK
jgi:uncharacterized protein YjbI with pentapeptide repeats